MNKLEKNTEPGKSPNGLDKIIMIISESSQNISKELCTLKDFPSVLPNIMKTLKNMDELLNVLNDVSSEVLKIESKENGVGKRGKSKETKMEAGVS
uniref:Uncharacterized protein n=1 Tax=Pithovirus LCPAC401 TaxID=2506595 RepID=A0A481ZB95_9VIRU|nr:MAG: hypothetical protein LCPAC401_00580 [Pithovirus LCPAC401]